LTEVARRCLCRFRHGRYASTAELLTDRSIAVEVIAAMCDRIKAQDGIADVPDLLAVYTGHTAFL
jgi:hypothetical protein